MFRYPHKYGDKWFWIQWFSCFSISFSKILEIVGKTITGQFFLSRWCFFLKTGVTSTNFRLSRNLPLMIASFTSFCKNLGETLWLSFNILGGMLFLLVAFLGLMFLISFSTSLLLTAEKEHLHPLDILLWINKTSGWCLYLAIVLWTGSDKLWQSLLWINDFSCIFKLQAAFSKNCLVSRQFFHLHLKFRYL